VDSPAEVGVKFRSDVAGTVTGSALLQKIDGQYDAHRFAMDCHGEFVSDWYVHRRNRQRLAAIKFRDTGSDHGEHNLHRVLPRRRRVLRVE
jgi:hypothetical protein